MTETEKQLVLDITSFTHDPLGFVLYAFPWGKKGTELEDMDGPYEWQREILSSIGEKLSVPKEELRPIRKARSSGHGIGKSALVAWVTLWSMSTREDTRCTITANTGDQLRIRTWPELEKWHRLAINRDWFTFTKTAFFSNVPDHEETWSANAVTCNADRSEAFQGLHNKGKRLLLVFDEASAIDNRIWDAAEGSLTDKETEIIWLAFGNPTRNTGRFRECFGRMAHRWDHKQIDSRNVPGTDLAQFEEWIEDYGEDHDFVRVRVRGVFPRGGINQFMAGDIVRAGMEREAQCHLMDALVMGLDVAREGDDENSLCVRRGKDARSFGFWQWRGMDTMQTAAKVVEKVEELKAKGLTVDMIFVDVTGVGGGVVDRLRLLGHRVIGVNFGAKSDGGMQPSSGAAGEKYGRKDAEMWGVCRSWLKEGGAIPDDPALEDQLTGREYGYNDQMEICLERKRDQKNRGGASPDRADSLVLTMSYPVVRSSDQNRSKRKTRAKTAYEPDM